MLVFFSGHGTPWYLTLFIFSVSLVSQGLDLTFFPYSLFGGPQIWNAWGGGAQKQQQSQEPGSSLARMACLALAIAASLCIFRFLFQVRNQIQRMGLRATLSLMRQTPLRDWPSRWFFPAAALQGAGAPAGGGQGGRRETHAQKVERISKRVQKLPTEEFMGREELDALPLHQLKIKLKSLGLSLKPGEAVDRAEATRLALEIGGSSSTSCGICCEDYVNKDSLRRLPACGHRFHLECVDRWLLSSSDYSRRQPCCPMCNTEV